MCYYTYLQMFNTCSLSQRAVDQKFTCIEQKEDELRKLQLVLREKERDLEKLQCVLSNNEETITVLTSHSYYIYMVHTFTQ